MTVLVTGGTGFLGKVLVRKLLAGSDAKIRLLVRDTRKTRGLDPERVEIVRGNMRDEGCLRAAVAGVDTMYHLASAMSGTWSDYLHETVAGTERLLRLAREAGVRRTVYVSSIAVLEVSRPHPVIDETTPLEEPYLTDYARSKVMAERVVREAVEQHGMDVVIARPGVIFGPGGSPLLPRVGYRAGSAVVAVGLRDIPIPTVYVENAADALIRVAEAGVKGEIYHLLDDEPVRKLRYLRLLKRAAPGRLAVTRIPYALARGAHLATGALGRLHPLFRKLHRAFPMLHLVTCSREIPYSNRKLRDLGWSPAVPLEEALERTLGAPSGRTPTAPRPEEREPAAVRAS